MGPLLNDWILARMMSAPKKDDSIIYKLQNHICDGTAATCINTGLRIFSRAFIQEHPKFQIEISYTADQNNADKAHIIRCNRPDSPYYGFYIRKNQQYIYVVKCSLSGSVGLDTKAGNTTQVRNLIIQFTFGRSWVVDVKNRDGIADQQKEFTQNFIYETTPFTIGGSVTNGVDETGGWKETWKGTINNLIIRDIE